MKGALDHVINDDAVFQMLFLMSAKTIGCKKPLCRVVDAIGLIVVIKPYDVFFLNIVCLADVDLLRQRNLLVRPRR